MSAVPTARSASNYRPSSASGGARDPRETSRIACSWKWADWNGRSFASWVLNTKNAVLRVVAAYQGNVSASLVRVGELFRDALRLDAAGVILVHNHPSGDPTPSPDEMHLTAEGWRPDASLTSTSSTTSSSATTRTSRCGTGAWPSIGSTP